MYNNEPTATLLQVLRDLSRTIEQMAPQQTLTAIERDLLLSEMQQLYAKVLDWTVGVPKAVVAEVVMPSNPAPATPIEAAAPTAPSAVEQVAATAEAILHEQVATVTEEVMEQLAEVVEDAVEEALESGKEVEFDIQLQVAEREEAAAEETVVKETASAEVEAASLASKAEAETVAEPVQEVEVAAPAATPSAAATHSVAFSLSGVLQKSGDSQLVMAHLKLKPIDDLKSGIGLNEKFLFIRELFNNDHLAYADAIEHLNASKSMEEAEKIIAEKLLPVYAWDLETEAVLSFLHLIFRRFAPNA